MNKDISQYRKQLLMDFARQELETYYYSSNVIFKENASKYYIAYLEKKGKKRIEAIDNYIQDKTIIKDILKDVLKAYKEENKHIVICEMRIRTLSKMINVNYSYDYLKQVFKILIKEV